MAYKFREEIVGKRFLSVSGFTKLKVNKISEWGWRAGVIRAASHRDNGCHDLQILVEYDDVEWQRREWLSPHRDAVFSFFLIERGLYWAERPDPRHASLIPIDHHNHANNNHHQHRINGKPLRGATAVADTVAWPALTFYPLVARAELHEDAMPIEFMQDRKLDFVDYSKLKPFTQDWELTKGTMPWGNAVRRWAEMQDGQRILLTTPSVLVGFRVEVYRAEGTTQWYTAVIVGYNESTKDLTVTDDTVLEDHNEDPTLVQMRLIGDGVVESIMRGEVVGMTPRRSRSSTALTHALVVPRPGRRPRRRPGNAAQLQATPRVQSPISQHLEKEKNNARNNRRRRVSEGASREKTEKDSTEAALSTRQQEDRENKGPPSGKVGNRVARPILEEANSASGSASKLRRRGAAVKSPTADHQGPAQHPRPVRRRPRPGSGQEIKPDAEEESVEPQHHHRTGSGTRADKDERLGSRSEEEEEEEEEERSLERENDKSPEHCDPLTKRLRTSPVGRKLRSESSKGKNAEEAAAERAGEVVVEEDDNADDEAGVEKHDGAEREVDKLEENEESQSRERDREPEPPPPDKVDPGGNSASNEQQPGNKSELRKDARVINRGADKIGERKEQQQQHQQQQQQPPQLLVNGLHVDSPLVSDKTNVIREDSPSLLKSTTRSKTKGFAEEDGEDAAAAAEDERDENASEEEVGSQRSRRTELTTTELGTEDSVGSVGGVRAASVESVVELLESSSQDSGSVLERLSPLSSSGGGGPGRQSSLLLEQQREQERSRHNESPIILVERLNKPPPPIAGHHHHHHLQPYHQPHHQQQQQFHHHHQQHHQQRYSASSPVIHHHHQQQQQPPPPPQHHHHQLTSSSHQHHHHPTAHLTPSSLLEVQQQSHISRGGDEAGGGLMEVEAGAGIPGAGVLAGVSTAVGGIRGSGGSNSGVAGTYGDSGSDSGVSSLRSAGSGDERSGSRSSALSVEETTSSSTPSAAAIATAAATPARVWHVQSIQHTTLLMAHPQGAANAAANAAATAPPVGYQSPAPPGHHAAVASEMLWRPIQSRGYPPLSHHTLLGPQPPSPEELLERDRHERMLRERREAEVRELEKAKMDRERLEKQRAEQAVHKHFEESLRLAQQKRNMQSASMAWSSFLPVVPPPTHPPSRTHGAPPGLTAHAAASHRGHPGHPGGTPGGAPAAAVAAHPVTVAQQQQQQREREEREIREIRERENLAAEKQHQRQTEARDHIRDHIAAQHQRAYYAITASPAQQVSRPSSVPGKVEYPPPPAHTRLTKPPVSSLHEKSSTVVGPSHSSLPKAEPNVNLFNYSSTYQPSCPPYLHDLKIQNELRQPPPKSLPGKSGLTGDHEKDHHGREVLQNPPSLLPDHKSSVIVKNEGRELAKAPAPQQHSSSSRGYLSLQPVAPQHKSSAYEAYRSPTQSPHHLHPAHLDGLQAAKSIAPSASHHRGGSGVPTTTTTQQLPSPHSHPPPLPAPPEPRLHPHNPRQSPHAPPSQHPHQPPPPPHPSPPEPRYLNRPEAAGLPYGAAKSTYSYPHPPTASPTPSSHYATPPPAGSKPKVSSPAPPHIYGKPNSGIMTGTPVCRASEPPVAAPIPLTSKTGSSPYQQVPHHHGAPPPPLPPPAHSRVYDSRFVSSLAGAKLPPPPLHGSPPTTASAPLSRSIAHPAHPAHLSTSPHQQSGQTLQHAQITTAFQTQPLDLGVERSGSPKRKAPTPLLCDNASGQPVSLEVCKKRRTEEPQPLSLQCVGQPVLSRVSEPSPLIASAATSITTVVNTAALLAQSNSQTTQEQRTVTAVSPAPGTASGDGSTRPASTGSVCSLNPAPLSAAPSPAPIPSPAPSTAPSPAPSAPGTPAKVNPGTGADSEKSNSPAPRPPSSTSYPGHKLKKAWLQRHSRCEDGTESTANMVSSVTLPLNISRETPSSNSKDRDSSNTSNVNANSSAPTTCLPSAVNSIHNIGSMAVNSINKSKVTGKSGRKPANKESLNGHATDTSKTPQEDSSSSDPERKSPPKRKPPKVKRKKGAARRQQTAAEDQRRRKEDKQGGAGAGSESSNESEAGSASDTSEQLSTIQPASRVRHTTANSNNSSGNGNNKEPRKRGRRPKTTKGNEVGGEDQQPRQKKERRDDSASGGNNGPGGSGGRGDPFRKPPISQLKKTGESWLQDGACFEVAPKLAKCRECRWTPHQRSKNLPQNIFCRFYAFRRLRYTKNGQLAIAGFSDPHKDASEEDLRLWLPGKDNQETTGKDDKSEKNEKDKGDREDLDLETAHRLLRQVGDQFCDLLHQEKDALQEHMAEASSGVVDATVAWKRVIQGVREMCDVCETTLFNYHWACGKCGFVVCIDCYKGRKNGTIKIWGESGKDRDEFSWLLCTNRQAHEPERLMLTQIIAGDSLLRLGQRLHECRAEWGIAQHCACSLVTSTQSNETLRNLIKGDSVPVLNGNVKQEVKEEKKINESNGSSESKTNGEDNSTLNWLADVALQNQDKNESGSSSDSDEDRENYSTLRELLIRPSHKSNGSGGSRSNSPTINSGGGVNATSGTGNNAAQNNVAKSGKKSKMDTLDEVISSVIEHSVKKEKDSGLDDEKPRELKHFVRRYKWTQRGREPLPIRIMTVTESKSLYPDVPHSWLCNGKLLRLNDPNNPNNYRIFQDQWKRGQPVIVSDVSKALDMNLWHPDSFARDFGDEKNDLINCMTGNLVPNQPMRKFWEGFENFSKRLKDERGNPMLLKLKDWPPGEDFAELLPSRFTDLMKVLPLSEYTHRNGRLNLASRLPNCFVRPDLGPKMYNAYGSALHPSKGTTNLHLDISDAVNVMVYVGIPKDADSDEHIKEALKAIDEAGCDVLTRRRARDPNEAPGALWHIYAARDADKIRDLLNAVALERGARLEPHHDPIHDQSCYLDGSLRDRLYREYGVEGYAIVQCLGDAVFVPAGAPHQVRNLHNCIKVAEDFVSPENVSHCFHLTQEFRALSDTHTNHEDKLQIKNIIYHAVKDSLTVLANVKEETVAKLAKASNETKIKEET